MSANSPGNAEHARATSQEKELRKDHVAEMQHARNEGGINTKVRAAYHAGSLIIDAVQPGA